MAGVKRSVLWILMKLKYPRAAAAAWLSTFLLNAEKSHRILKVAPWPLLMYVVRYDNMYGVRGIK